MATAPGRLGKKSKGKKAEQGSQTHKLPALADERLDVSTLETWLWDAACAIRGATDAPKFKDFILPLVFFKRLSDVFDDEFAGQVKTFGDEEIAREVIKADHEDALKDYNERQSGQRTLDDDRLASLIEVVSRHRLGLKNAEPDILGRAYEYLL